MGPKPELKPVLPLEILEYVVDCVGQDQSQDYAVETAIEIPRIKRNTLLSCAFTCRALLPRARMHLFRTISLRHTLHLNSFVSAPPPILSHVQTLEVHESLDAQPYGHLVPHYMATKLPCLTRLQVRTSPCSDHDRPVE